MDSFNIYMLCDILLPLDIDSLIKMLQITPFYHNFIQRTNHVTEWFWKEYFEYHEYLPEETNLKRALRLRGLHKWFPIKRDYGEFINCKKLGYHKKQMSVIPESLSLLIELEELELYNNQISEIPENLVGLINLKYLYLYDNQII